MHFGTAKHDVQFLVQDLHLGWNTSSVGQRSIFSPLNEHIVKCWQLFRCGIFPNPLQRYARVRLRVDTLMDWLMEGVWMEIERFLRLGSWLWSGRFTRSFSSVSGFASTDDTIASGVTGIDELESVVVVVWDALSAEVETKSAVNDEVLCVVDGSNMSKERWFRYLPFLIETYLANSLLYR